MFQILNWERYPLLQIDDAIDNADACADANYMFCVSVVVMSSDIAEDIAVATVTATLRLVGFVHPEPFGSDAIWS